MGGGSAHRAPAPGEALGEQVRRESGIGGPGDTEQLRARIATLEWSRSSTWNSSSKTEPALAA
ncbi:hypothetical protein [Streptomyces sp. HUAS TT7]|uniref:hypothetical protein n=1 Tax=Streptomyces sp. HUAS TT7 TaxID=3447507 RepID=UPI003F65D11F